MADSNDDLAFVAFEKGQLAEIKAGFTPADEKKYGEEVAYINSLLDLLEKQAKKPDTKANEKERERTKKRIQGATSKLVNSLSFKKMTDTTLDALPPEAIEDAKLVEIGTKFYKNNGIDSENLVAQTKGLDKNWVLDQELSDSRGVVLHNPKTGKTKVAYRGTDARGMNLDDIQTDAQIYAGSEGNTTHFQDAQKQMQDTIAKYGKEDLSVTGYSLGGNKSLAMGQAYDVPSTGFNSFIGKSLVKRADQFTGTKHTIYRTREDLPSIQSAWLKGRSNIDVHVVGTRGSLARAMNPYSAHALDNFTSNEDRQTESKFVDKVKELAEHAEKHGELSIFDEMIEANKEQPTIRPEKTLYQRELDARVDALPEPHLPRIEDITVGVNPLAKPLRSKAPRDLPPPIEDIRLERNPLLGEPEPKPSSSKPKYDFSEVDLTAVKKIPHNKFVGRLTTDLAANTGNEELDDLLRFTQDQLKTRTKQFKVDPKTVAKLKGLRDKTEPPTERPTNSSRALARLTDRLEDRAGLDFETSKGTGGLFPTRSVAEDERLKALEDKRVAERAALAAEPEITPSRGSFTEFANRAGIDPASSHHKILWQKAGGELTSAESQNIEDVPTSNTDSYLSEFAAKDGIERGQDILEHAAIQQGMEKELNEFHNSGIRAPETSYLGEVARGVHPSNLLVGLGAGAIASEGMKRYVDPVLKQDKDSDLRVAEEGAATGFITAGILGTAAAPEVAAGAAGYVAGKEATSGIYKGLKSIGANEDTSASVADIGGGAAGGAAAGLSGTIAASAIAGSAIGPEGTVIGAGIGAVLGAAAFGLGKLGIGNETEDFVAPDKDTGVTKLDFGSDANP